MNIPRTRQNPVDPVILSKRTVPLATHFILHISSFILHIPCRPYYLHTHKLVCPSPSPHPGGTGQSLLSLPFTQSFNVNSYAFHTTPQLDRSYTPTSVSICQHDPTQPHRISTLNQPCVNTRMRHPDVHFCALFLFLCFQLTNRSTPVPY